MGAPDGVNRPGHPDMGSKAAKTEQLAKRQMKDSHFWQPQGETYSNHAGRFFKPGSSSTFSLIKLDNVNVTFLDNTNLRGNICVHNAWPWCEALTSVRGLRCLMGGVGGWGARMRGGEG